MTKSSDNQGSVCQNRKAAFRYEILERLDCGIELRGSEVKSLREREVSIEEAYARIDDGQLWLIGARIAPYAHAPPTGHEPDRKRRLLAHSREIRKLKPRLDRERLTLIPLRVYFNERGIAKVSIGLARGKSLSDKRETLRAKEHKREMERAAREPRRR